MGTSKRAVSRKAPKATKEEEAAAEVQETPTEVHVESAERLVEEDEEEQVDVGQSEEAETEEGADNGDDEVAVEEEESQEEAQEEEQEEAQEEEEVQEEQDTQDADEEEKDDAQDEQEEEEGEQHESYSYSAHHQQETSSHQGGQQQESEGGVRTVHVKNIPLRSTEEDLSDFFQQFGRVAKSSVVKDRGGMSRGFGFVMYEDDEGAANAVAGSGVIMEGRQLTVELVRI